MEAAILVWVILAFAGFVVVCILVAALVWFVRRLRQPAITTVMPPAVPVTPAQPPTPEQLMAQLVAEQMAFATNRTRIASMRGMVVDAQLQALQEEARSVRKQAQLDRLQGLGDPDDPFAAPPVTPPPATPPTATP